MCTWQPPPQSPGRGQLRPADLVLQKQHESIATPRSSVLWLKSEVPPGGLSGSKGESWALSEGWVGGRDTAPGTRAWVGCWPVAGPALTLQLGGQAPRC